MHARLRPFFRLALVAGLAATTAGLVGCKGEPEAAPASRPAVVAGSAVVSGTVKFDGTPPALRLIAEADAAKCHPGAKPVYDDSLVVDADGGLRNVVVYVVDGPNVTLPSTRPAVVLDQSSCRYAPHVLAVRAGEPLKLRSSDPIQHNVHAAKPANNKAFSLPFVSAGEERSVTFARAESAPPIEVRCDVHQWMRAYVAVFDHPFYAVTGDGGRFEFKGLPAGKYTLVAWHERYGETRQELTVGTDGSPPSVQFHFGT